MKTLLVCLFSLAAATSAYAQCPSKSPSASSVQLEPGDQKVNKAWLEKTLAGKKVKFKEGTEIYQKDGSYRCKVQNGAYDAPSYRFYDSGFRCIGYSNPRFDYSVVNGGKLYQINASGNRFQGRITN
jgi:hypothetical protein